MLEPLFLGQQAVGFIFIEINNFYPVNGVQLGKFALVSDGGEIIGSEKIATINCLAVKERWSCPFPR